MKQFKPTRPGPFSQVRRFYYWYKDRLIGDIVDVEKPKPKPEPPIPTYKGDPYFKVGAVRRLTKIEDDDDDNRSGLGDDDIPFQNSSQLNASSVSLPGLNRPRRDSQAVSIASNLSYSNLPSAARPYKPSWSSQNLDQLQDNDNPNRPLPAPPLPYGAGKPRSVSSTSSSKEGKESTVAASGPAPSPLRENFPFENVLGSSHLLPVARLKEQGASAGPSPVMSRANSAASGAISSLHSTERYPASSPPAGPDALSNVAQSPTLMQ